MVNRFREVVASLPTFPRHRESRGTIESIYPHDMEAKYGPCRGNQSPRNIGACREWYREVILAQSARRGAQRNRVARIQPLMQKPAPQRHRHGPHARPPPWDHRAGAATLTVKEPTEPGQQQQKRPNQTHRQ